MRHWVTTHKIKHASLCAGNVLFDGSVLWYCSLYLGDGFPASNNPCLILDYLFQYVCMDICIIITVFIRFRVVRIEIVHVPPGQIYLPRKDDGSSLTGL